MKRDALEEMVAWKNRVGHKPLVLRGARQVGKTWLMREFGRLHYEHVAYVSLLDSPYASRLFEGDFQANRLLQGISMLCGVEVKPGKTLVILDEIQECERALTALKFLRENAPEYDIMAAGSLLGVAARQKKMSFPVGQVEFLDLYPLSFAEFLQSVGESSLCHVLRTLDMSLLPLVHERYVERLRQYMWVGGMPEAVQAFADGALPEQVRSIQLQILTGYESDFSKYTESFNIARIHAAWQSLPSQLSHENKKFVYGRIAQGARAREYEMALEWLRLCGLVYRIPRISKPAVPLSAYADAAAFKLFMSDTGLLCAKAGLDAQVVMSGTRIFEEFKGALTEQFVLQELMAMKSLPVAYWASEGIAELDFVVQHSDDIVPIEVKACTNLRARSLAAYRAKYEPRASIRTSLAGFEARDGLFNIPLYMMGQWRDIINYFSELSQKMDEK